jgi:hypothetical protein
MVSTLWTDSVPSRRYRTTNTATRATANTAVLVSSGTPVRPGPAFSFSGSAAVSPAVVDT